MVQNFRGGNTNNPILAQHEQTDECGDNTDRNFLQEREPDIINLDAQLTRPKVKSKHNSMSFSKNGYSKVDVEESAGKANGNLKYEESDNNVSFI